MGILPKENILAFNFYLIPCLVEIYEFAKSKTFVIADTLEYVSDSVMIKNIIKKVTGNVTVLSFDCGKTLTGKILPFDTFVQIIDGKAEIIINEQSNLLNTGEFIIIPAHSRNTIKAHIRFTMLSTTIKSGYEDVSCFLI